MLTRIERRFTQEPTPFEGRAARIGRMNLDASRYLSPEDRFLLVSTSPTKGQILPSGRCLYGLRVNASHCSGLSGD